MSTVEFHRNLSAKFCYSVRHSTEAEVKLGGAVMRTSANRTECYKVSKDRQYVNNLGIQGDTIHAM